MIVLKRSVYLTLDPESKAQTLVPEVYDVRPVKVVVLSER